MRVFVLTVGRTGSVTFWRACRHITNYTSHHEASVQGLPAIRRVKHPDHHIAVDPRLCWMLGLLEVYGQDAFYVHLVRDPDACARSWAKKAPGGANETKWSLIEAWRTSILQGAPADKTLEIARDLVNTANANIVSFLRDKPHMLVSLETAKVDFARFWDEIDALGDWEAALAEWDTKHNASP